MYVLCNPCDILIIHINKLITLYVDLCHYQFNIYISNIKICKDCPGKSINYVRIEICPSKSKKNAVVVALV